MFTARGGMRDAASQMMRLATGLPCAETGVSQGGKARALSVLMEAGFNIPRAFVVFPEAFTESLTVDQQHAWQQVSDPDQLRRLVEQVVPGRNLSLQVAAEIKKIDPSPTARFAVRSSAIDEDGSRQSFAGQLESFLYVAPDDVPDQIAAVWRSGFSERILAYRREHKLPLVPTAPAVLVQQMIDSDVAGVAFGADPVSGQWQVAVVSAVYGLGTSLVSGEADADTWRVDRTGEIVSRKIVKKWKAHLRRKRSPGGVSALKIDEEKASAPTLSDARAREVASLAHRAGDVFGRPQDIEWAYAGGELFLLQSRPITGLRNLPDPDGAYHLWDNSNIAESYSGVTTPMTFSFARSIYEEVYRQFCRIMAVPEQKIAEHRDTFRRMLGLVRGRIYYNLVSWHEVLALLPGYQINRGFMEQMMGVKEPLPEDALPHRPEATGAARVRDGLDLARTLGGLIANHFQLRKNIELFYIRLIDALGESETPLAEMRADELVTAYRELERRLLTRWDAPLINDFFAMIFYGTLRKLASSWCGDTHGTLQNDLLSAEGGMVSAEPARRIRQMAEEARGHPELIDALCTANAANARRALQAHPRLEKLFQSYLEAFGDRCLEELKLESETLHDDPTSLLRSTGFLARRLGAEEKPAPAPDTRAQAEQSVRTALEWKPFKRAVFHWVLRHTRARVRDRENLRFERTRLFGRVRRILMELGRRFHAIDALDDPRDVFYLTLEETLGFVDGTSASNDLRAIAAARKAEFERYRRMPAPADRFETRGIVASGQPCTAKSVSAVEGESLTGIGCCPGVVRGRARVVLDPRGATLADGEILVAQRTDPGWIMLFPSAKGLLVEYGSLLSHSAIVARELGIPAVVSITGLTGWIRDGDEVELDGSTGEVRRITAR